MLFQARLGYVLSVVLGANVSLPAQEAMHFAPIEVTHAKPYVMVMVNGQGPFRFVIDTGTGGQAFVTPELADQLELPAAGKARLTDPSGQGGQRAQVVSIKSLQVAGVEFTGIKAIRHALSSEDGSCQGLLGFTLFRDYLLTLDFPNRRITLAAGALEPDGESSVLPFRMPDGVPIAALRIGGLRIEAQFDSGGGGLSLPESIASRMKFAADPEVFGNGQSLSTRFQVKQARLGADVHLGRYTFSRPFVEINPAFPLANFGSSAMQNFAITFDQENMLMRFQASQKRFTLLATPTAIRLINAPQAAPAPGLVPAG